MISTRVHSTLRMSKRAPNRDRRTWHAGHMMNRDPEFGPEDDLQDVLRQVHIYDAIAVAASDAHAVLDVMLTAANPEAANRALVDRYAFTEVQAWAVMDVQFRRLTATDRKKIEQRHRELGQRVQDLEQQLGRA